MAKESLDAITTTIVHTQKKELMRIAANYRCHRHGRKNYPHGHSKQFSADDYSKIETKQKKSTGRIAKKCEQARTYIKSIHSMRCNAHLAVQ